MAAPIATIVATGFGRPGGRSPGRTESIAAFVESRQGIWTVVESAGRIGRRLLTVIGALGGAMTAEQLAFQTPGADPVDIDDAVDRLVAAGALMRVGRDGAVALSPAAKRFVAVPSISLADQNAITSDVLAIIGRALGLSGVSRKQDRIDQIATLFADPAGQQRVRAALSDEAVSLLGQIAETAGPGAMAPEPLGIAGHQLHSAEAARFPFQRAPVRGEVAALYELTSRGIVGVAGYEHKVWIWIEAWPLVGRPFFTDWTSPPCPRRVDLDAAPPRLPAIVAALDRCLQAWEINPPAALKNRDPRLAKPDVKSTAKKLGVDAATVDLAARLAIGIGLLRRTTIAVSGRGRHQQLEEAWLGDRTMTDAWAALSPARRWVRLLSAWFAQEGADEAELVMRQLLVLQLSQLASSQGYASESEFVAWLADRNAPLASETLLLGTLAELRCLGIATASGPIAMTAVGRRGLETPDEVAELVDGRATSAVIQGDLSIIAPPDLRSDLSLRLETIAVPESEAGAFVYRLDPARITAAVQAGATREELSEFLASLSAAPLPNTVERLLRDAAAKAGTVRIESVSTVVIVTDPADLATACAIAALRLVRVADTVAITVVSSAKVRAALERKGLSPQTSVVSQSASVSSADEAAEAVKRAAALRSAAPGRATRYFEHEARLLEAHAKALGDVAGRLAVQGPLAATIDVLEQVGTMRSRSNSGVTE